MAGGLIVATAIRIAGPAGAKREVAAEDGKSVMEIIGDAGSTSCWGCAAELRGEQLIRAVPGKKGKADRRHGCVKGLSARVRSIGSTPRVRLRRRCPPPPSPTLGKAATRMRGDEDIAYDVVIVGAGHGGAQAAIALRQRKFEGLIAIVGEEPELPYERPPLSKDYLAGERSFERLLIRPPTFWEERRVTMRLGERAVAVDPAGHTIRTAGGATIGYRYLVWATGGTRAGSPAPATTWPACTPCERAPMSTG